MNLRNMQKGIVIGSQKHREKTWLRELLDSLKGNQKYPVEVNFTDKFELASIKWALKHTNWDEFLFLPDSTIVSDLSFLDKVFDKQFEGRSVSICREPGIGGMYMMKYRREILEKLPIPDVPNKRMAVYWEMVFHAYYGGIENVVVLFPEVKHTNIIIKKHGRENMVIGNKYFMRYKGDWGQRPV